MQGYFAPASLGRPPARDNVQNIVLVSGDNSTWLLARATCARRTGNDGESLSRALSNVIHIVTANFPAHDPLPFHDINIAGQVLVNYDSNQRALFSGPNRRSPSRPPSSSLLSAKDVWHWRAAGAGAMPRATPIASSHLPRRSDVASLAPATRRAPGLTVLLTALARRRVHRRPRRSCCTRSPRTVSWA
jgi:hypothetical protein